MPLEFPDVGIQNVQMRLRRSVAVAESPFSFDQQVHDFGGARWEAEVTLEPLSFADSRKVDAFLIALKGRSGTFRFGNPKHSLGYSATTAQQRGIGSETITATGDSIPAGVYFSLGNYLHILTQDFNGSGSMVFQPPLKEVVPNSTTVNFTSPKSLWRLASNDIGWSQSATFTSYTIPMVEAI